MEYTEQIHIRVTPHEKEILNNILENLNETRLKKVGYRYILFNVNVNEYLENNNNGLEIQINELLKDIETDNEQINKIVEKRTEKEIQLKKLRHELNNKSLFDISNYKDNEPILKGFNRLKEIVINPDNNINYFEDIDNITFKQMQTSFNIKDLQVFKKIVKTHFKEWQKEKVINKPEPTEKTYNEKLETILKVFNRRFNSEKGQHGNDKARFLKANETHYKTMCENKGINYNDLENEILKDIDKI